MSYVENIVERFGGTRRMALVTGFPASTIQSWKKVGSIPDRHKPNILESARVKGIALEEVDFFPHPTPASSEAA